MPIVNVGAEIQTQSDGTTVVAAGFSAAAGTSSVVALTGASPLLDTLAIATGAASQVQATVRVVTQFPADVAEPPARFQPVLLLDLHVEASANAVDHADVGFHLDAADLVGQDPAQVRLIHFRGGAWVAEPTRILSVSAQGVKFGATVQSFSPFAIAFETSPAVAPRIVPASPAPGAVVDDPAPVIRASFELADGAKLSQASLKLDGAAVQPDSADDGGVTFSPSSLSDGIHWVSVTVLDSSGLETRASWSFTVRQGEPLGRTSLAPGEPAPPASPDLAIVAALALAVIGAAAGIALAAGRRRA